MTLLNPSSLVAVTRSEPKDPARRHQHAASRDWHALSEAFHDLASVLDSRTVADASGRCAEDVSADSWWDSRLLACRLVAEHLGVELRRRPQATEAFDLAELCELNHIRHRRVRLDPSWWRRDAGAIVGAWKVECLEEPPGQDYVALLPAGAGSYEYVEPVSSERRPVTAEVARRLDSHGWVFYRPLPNRPLGWIDLARAGWRGLQRDFATLVFASLASGLLALAVPVITGVLVDQAIVPGSRPALAYLAGGLVAAACAAAVFRLLHGWTLLRLKSRIDGNLQAALWDRLLALPVAFYRRFTVGDMGSRAMGLDRIRSLLTGDVTSAALSLVAAIASWGILFYYSWPMALLATGLAAGWVGFTVAVAVLQLRGQRGLQRSRGKLASLMYALIGGIEKLRAGQGEARAFAVWSHRFAEQRRYEVGVQRLANHQATFTAVYGVAGTLSLFGMVAATAGAGMSLGQVLAFHAAYGQFQAAVIGTVAIVPTLLGFVPTYERIQPILQAVPESDVERQDPGRLRGELELREVSFRYGEASPSVLDRISLRIEPGEFVALVGPSGSGKSTCLRLLLGFETPASGLVLIDGRDLRELDRHLVRRQTGAVLQNHQPTGGDIFHNIVGSRPLTMEDAWRAARQVGLAEEIESLPMGMLTPVNRRGVSFSGGQRQRMMIARAIVHRPRILLFDEATSALDNRTQDLVTRGLAALQVTRLVIAHRLSTVRYADRILVLDRGRLVEQGTYDQLLSAGGLFSRMAQRQMISPQQPAREACS